MRVVVAFAVQAVKPVSPSCSARKHSILHIICTPSDFFLSVLTENVIQLMCMDDVRAAGPPVKPVPAVPPNAQTT